jgi:hypothetical protein
MKFLEWFYCMHTCIFRAYWEGSPSKYSPRAAMLLAQCWCHCWKHFWNSCCGLAQFHCHISFWMPSMSWNLHPFKVDFISGNSQKSFRAKSGVQQGYSISENDFWARNYSTESTLLAGVLSWWRIQSLGQRSGLFLHTASCNHFNISR